MRKTVTLSEVEIDQIQRALGARMTELRSAIASEPLHSRAPLKTSLGQVLDASEALRAGTWETR